MSDNLYLELELPLDDPTVRFDDLKKELGDKVAEWNKLANVPGSKYKHMVQIATAFCERTRQPEPPEPTLIDLWKEARDKREKEGKQKVAIYEEKGILEQVEYDALHREFSQFFKKSTIDSWFTLKVEPPFVPPPKPMLPNGIKEIEKTEMDKIAADLKVVLGNEDANLYDLLQIPTTATLETIQSTQKTVAEKAAKKPKSGKESAKVDAEVRVLGLAKIIFKDEFSRQGYDIARKRRPFDKLVDTAFQIRAQKKNITHEEYEKSIDEARQVGLTPAEAEWYVYDYYCGDKKTDGSKKTPKCPLPRRKVVLPPRQQCPECNALNDVNAKVCRCGIPLKIKCPRCGREGSFGDKACTQCSFPLGDMPIAVKRLEQAKQAIADGNFEEADELIRQVNVYWKDAPGADVVRKSLTELREKDRKVKEQIQKLEAQIKDAIGKKEVYKARELFHQLRQIPEAAARLQTEEKIVNQTIAEVQPDTAKLTSVNDRSAKTELCEKILNRIADCPVAKAELGKIPPLPPENLVATVIPTGIELKWAAPIAKSLLTFIVVRKIGGTPASVSDGTRIQDSVTHSGFVDSTIDIGVVYGYTVFTQRDKTIETTGCRSVLIQKIEDIGNVSILPGDSSLTVSWTKQPASRGMIVTRFTGNTATGNGTQVALQSENSFVDSNLANGTTYCYKIQTVFLGIDGKDCLSSGKAISATPQVPPKVIDDLRASEAGDDTILQWSVPPHGDVVLFDVDTEPEIPVGTVEWTTLVVLKERYGESIPVRNKGQTSWKNTSTGVRYILPITFHNGLAVFGKSISVIKIDDVSEPNLDYIGDRLRLTWKWPKGLQKVLISYRHDQHPTGTDDVLSAKIVLSRQEYNIERAWFLPIGHSQEYYFCIYAVVERDTQNAYSRGVPIQTTKITIKYDLSIRRPYIYWGQIEAKLFLTIVSPRGKFPDMIVKRNLGKPPLNREYGEPFIDIPAKSGRELVIQLDVNQLEKNDYIKVFVKNKADEDRYDIDSPPRDKLHLCFKKPLLRQLYREIINLILRRSSP